MDSLVQDVLKYRLEKDINDKIAKMNFKIEGLSINWSEEVEIKIHLSYNYMNANEAG